VPRTTDDMPVAPDAQAAGARAFPRRHKARAPARTLHRVGFRRVTRGAPGPAAWPPRHRRARARAFSLALPGRQQAYDALATPLLSWATFVPAKNTFVKCLRRYGAPQHGARRAP